METYIPNNMEFILKKDIKRFKNYLLEESYEEFNDYDNEKIFNFYILSIMDNPEVMKAVRDKCVRGGVDLKEFNKFMYIMMKYNYKLKNGIFSWYEIDSWDVPFEDIKQTTLSYTLI